MLLWLFKRDKLCQPVKTQKNIGSGAVGCNVLEDNTCKRIYIYAEHMDVQRYLEWKKKTIPLHISGNQTFLRRQHATGHRRIPWTRKRYFYELFAFGAIW